MKITNPITLDVARSNSYICLLGKQFDSNSRYLQVTLTNNGQPLPIPSGAGVVLRATRADGAGSMTAGTVNGDGTALVEIDEAVLEVAGAASLSIEVTSGGQVLTSASCNLTVQKADASGWVKVYVAAASVSAGTYHISLGGQSYSFTTTQTIPAGGAIYFNSDGGTAQTRDASGNVLDASLTLTAGTSGTELTSDVPTMTFLAALAQQVGQLADTDNLVAGSAEALLGGGTAENVAVALRGNAGNAREKIGKLIGGTIAWNMMVNKSGFPASSGIFTNNGDGSVTANGTPGSTATFAFQQYAATDFTVGHKYFIHSGFASTGSGSTFELMLSRVLAGTTNLNFYGATGIFECGDNSNSHTLQFVVRSGTTVNNFKCTPILIDLTVALGPTIADYVYTLESGTAGAGVAWLARYFPKILGGYYAYAAPALLSVNVEGKKISGFNLWDEEWESGDINITDGAKRASSTRIRSKNFTPVIPNMTYYCKSSLTNTVMCFYDGEKKWVSAAQNVGWSIATNTTFTAPSWCYYIMLYGNGTTYNHDININLSNPILNGKYFPHREFYYPIQSGELRGVPKLDANNNLTFDGDWQEPDGTRTRRYGAVDLGTLTWTYDAGNTRFYTPFTNGAATVSNLISAVYLANSNPIGTHDKTNYICVYGGRIYLTNFAYTDAATFKTAMSGVYLVYELATPYTEAGQPFLAVERLDNGIEEVVDAGVEAGTRDVVVPVGQDATIYRDLAALLGAIPNPPASAGTYTLHATVTTTNATFSWS